jgi:hypothetical protein
MSHKYNKDDDYKRDIRLDNVPPPTPSPVPPPPTPSHYPHSPYHRRRPSRFLLFLLSFLPGLSHIYLGLIRRGLFYISALPILIYATVVFASNLGIFVLFPAFSIAALFAVAFFESFSIRRDIIMGKEVKDTIPNLGIFGGNKVVIFVLGVLLALALGVNILARLPWYAWLILGIIAVIYAPIARGKNRKKSLNDESNGKQESGD